MMTFRVTVTDLIHDGLGWSANGCWVNRYEVSLPDSASDLAITRACKRAAGIQGMRADYWAANELCWRSGTIGAWAKLID